MAEQKKDWAYYDSLCERILEEIEDLEEKSGILTNAKSIRSGPIFWIPTPILNDTPIWSDRFREENKEDDIEEQHYIDTRMRRLYLSIPNSEARKNLISKWRELENAEKLRARVRIDEANQDLRKAKNSGRNWVFGAAIISIICVSVGYIYYQYAGAIIGGLVSFFFGMSMRDNARHQRESEIKTAEQCLCEMKTSMQEVINRPYLFSSNEARSGEPDNGKELRYTGV